MKQEGEQEVKGLDLWESAATDRDDKVQGASRDLPQAIYQLGIKDEKEKCSLNGVGAVKPQIKQSAY
ncbi:hypothetical protein AWU65_20290 [Paenibacillus glucanolyticus]|uniref:Uncharacterized protein n=1 Tax=Paenibacillus glucanolyticus TaxID=59843 RepID=A0A163LG02_9BACL|nr:hypothetical protein [Paenibacillus glucanolyticus]KZS48098.1 hypothetical protein AWU65_20290 [Paenibacillus glucanolyticus]